MDIYICLVKEKYEYRYVFHKQIICYYGNGFIYVNERIRGSTHKIFMKFDRSIHWILGSIVSNSIKKGNHGSELNVIVNSLLIVEHFIEWTCHNEFYYVQSTDTNRIRHLQITTFLKSIFTIFYFFDSRGYFGS